MKKSTLLSLLTTAAIITTTAGTYATWDKLNAKTTSTISFREPVKVTVNQTYNLTESEAAFKQTPSASGDVSFSIDNNTVKNKQLAKELKLTPSILCSDNSVTLDNFNIEIIDKNEGSGTDALKGTKSDGFIDTTLTSTEYTVKVTPTTNTVAGKSISVVLDAELK